MAESPFSTVTVLNGGRGRKGKVKAGAGVAAVGVVAVGVIAHIALIVRHLGRKHLAAPEAHAVRVHAVVGAGFSARTGGLVAVGKVVGVGLHRVVLAVLQMGVGILVRAGQILLQIAGIEHVVVAVHQRFRPRVLIHQIDRVAGIQQVGHYLLVRAAVIAQHLDLPDLHRTLAGDLDAVCI